MSMESIVRPFRTPDVAPAKPFFVAGKAAAQPVVLQFGRGGGGRVLHGSGSMSATFYMTQYDNEKKNANWGVSF